MRIRPPVVRKMNQDLWAKMDPRRPVPQTQPLENATPSEIDMHLGQLRELGELRDTGVLTEEEFLHLKAKILG
jgi:Short C-terminal domain